MTELTLSVPEVHCDHCKHSIESAVSAVSGVDSVMVNIDPKTVDVEFDQSKVSLESIIAAIEEQGYEVAH